MRARQPGDRGVTIVEAAFSLPILFMFAFGLVDLGMWSFHANQATNAARDGARAGVLAFEDADIAGTPDHDAIVDAVRSHLPDASLKDFAVTVGCVSPDGTDIDCDQAEVDVDRIRVEAEWHWPLLTPVSDVIGVEEGVARGSATMAIVGLPYAGGTVDGGGSDGSGTTTTTTTTTSVPATCAVSTMTVTPSSVPSKANQLTAPVTIEFVTNGSAACSDLRVELLGTKTNADPIEHPCGCDTDMADQHEWVYSGSNNIWQAGKYGTVRVKNGSIVLAEKTFWVS